MYSNNDIQNMIQAAKANKQQFFDRIDGASISQADKIAIKSAINDGWYEAFDKYDSEVCDHFITIFEQI